MSIDLFDEKGTMKKYLVILENDARAETTTGTTTGENRPKRVIALIKQLFLAKLGKENYELWLTGKITVAECLRRTNISLKRSTMMEMLCEAFDSYKKGLTAGFGAEMNNDPLLKSFLIEDKTSKPFRSRISESGAEATLEEIKPIFIAQNEQPTPKKSDKSKK